MTKQLFSVLALALLILSSCNKEEAITELTETTTSTDFLKMEQLYDDIEYEADYRMEEKSGTFEDGKYTKDDDCPTLTWSAPPGTFPNTLVIDFGTGCTSASGSTKAGQIVVNQSDPMPTVGAVRTITLVNFSINGIQIEGTKSLTNNGPVGPAQRSFTRTLVGGQVTFLNGDVATKDATRTLSQLDGLGTDTFIDDIFAITGGSQGVNRNGVPYSTNITEPLIKERNCHWLISGVRDMTFGPFSRSIDYGNGFCDPFAVVTNGQGQSHIINLNN
ncbi:MAG: hypothetical protein AAF502_19605 [Bacteroidota bacterium]